ncbi:MAG TPA: AAA family ATPase [Candidatus Polarisedimenticolaceae bacterium]|nr:AAA family ATPase [Candidatus Polarisedimenticolaceae bacterium]
MSYQLSPDQIAALQAIGRWYRAASQQYMTLGGYAGTGKTTMIGHVRQALRDNDPDVKVAFCSFTGKAVRVLDQTLKRQGVSRRGDSLTTIHGLIYNSELNSDGQITGWRRRKTLKADLIMVDEASMVTQDLWNDLLKFKVPVLAVGDHGQLPPVGANFNLMDEPMIKLERVYRQAVDSPIVEVATLARTTGHIPPGRYGDEVVKYSRRSDELGSAMEELLSAWNPEWLVLCGYNHTRVRLNAELRTRRGFEYPDPQPGEHLICLRNNATGKLYNGMTGTLKWLQPATDDPGALWWEAGILIDDAERQCYLLKSQFGSRETVSTVPPSPEPKVRGDLFDFGYALTVHKAQGSSADTVLVFEERNKHMSDDDWRRWLYTAVTRAERRLIIVGD